MHCGKLKGVNWSYFTAFVTIYVFINLKMTFNLFKSTQGKRYLVYEVKDGHVVYLSVEELEGDHVGFVPP